MMSPDQATGGSVICPFRLLSGLPCPGCGLTRAWVFALHGDLGAALAANPFVLVTLPAAVALVLAVVAASVRRRPPPDPRLLLRLLGVQLLVGTWILFAVVRAGAVLAGAATVCAVPPGGADQTGVRSVAPRHSGAQNGLIGLSAGAEVGR